MASVLASCVTRVVTDHPLVGAWSWNHVSGQCPETHTYDAAGYKETKSGEEILRHVYTIQAIEVGAYRVESEVIYSNGKNDCTGSPTPIGARSSIVIRMLKGGGYFTCRTIETLSCEGTAIPKR
jgi:hypothetical protein